MVESKALPTSITVVFFHTTCADLSMTATGTLSMIIADLLKVLQSPLTASPIFNCQRDVSEAIKTLQTVLIRNNTT